jgi:RNA polymerase sigma factor (sigma-70 family)
MRDSEVVASIVAGDPEGLAEAYDRYSGALFGYCRSLLREPADAADAVQDTFVIAASKLTRLRDPERLRAWLFAVARNECLHRLKSREAAPLADLPEQPDDSADVGAEAERAETRALMRAAADGLNDGERDVINQLWHGLEVPEVAAVLGVSRNHAYSLFSRARDQLEASVAVLVVGRSGRKDCAALDRLLSGWDGRLNATLRKRVGRHIDRCMVCSDRRRQELQPALLLSLTPGALLAITLARDHVPALAGAAARLAGPPPGLRAEVLRLASSTDPHAAAFRATVGRSTRPFGMNGFPRPAHYGHLGLTSMPHLPLGVVGGTAVAAVVVTAIGPYAHHRPPAPRGTATVALAPTTGAAASARPAGLSTTTAGQSLSTTGGSAIAGRTRTARSRRGPAAAASPPASGSPTATAVATASPTGAATPTPSATAASAPPAAGTLSASPATVVLAPLLGGTLTLTATGGPVAWSISEPSSLLGSLTVSPSSGTVYPGSPVTVTLTVSGLTSLDTTLTVSPGGQAVTVLLALGL